MGNPGLIGQKSPAQRCSLRLCVHRQAAAIGVFLRLFRLGVLALQISERHVRR